ncbi:MAG TPA: hypothetical protein PKO38_08485 [Bacillota bacterium]|nr:hypothetical protein [Bacillota bacterium]
MLDEYQFGLIPPQAQLCQQVINGGAAGQEKGERLASPAPRVVFPQIGVKDHRYFDQFQNLSSSSSEIS